MLKHGCSNEFPRDVNELLSVLQERKRKEVKQMMEKLKDVA